MGQLDGKVAFITGIARGQGVRTPLTLAREGADIIGLDICTQPATTPYPGATPKTWRRPFGSSRETGRKIVAEQADVRDLAQVRRCSMPGSPSSAGWTSCCPTPGSARVG